jgi:hypothetical protein
MKNDDLYIPSKMMQVTNIRTEFYQKSAKVLHWPNNLILDMLNLAKATKSELLVDVKGKEKPNILSIYAQTHFMGPIYTML